MLELAGHAIALELVRVKVVGENSPDLLVVFSLELRVDVLGTRGLLEVAVLRADELALLNFIEQRFELEGVALAQSKLL